MSATISEVQDTALTREKSNKSVKSLTRLCHRLGAVRPVNRVLANLYTQPLNSISVNPFVNLWQTSRLELLRVWTIGALMVVVRIVPMIFFILFSCFLAKLCLGIIWLLNWRRINSEPFRQVARDTCFGFMRVGLFFAGFYWIRIIDYRRDKNRFAPIIPVAPHSSFFDILIILKLKRPTFVSKAENQQALLIGNVLRLCKGIYVDRADKNSRQNTINEIRSRANNGEQILIFPEGTCANRTSLVQFKMGAFIPKLPVQPIIARWDAGDHMDSVTWSWEGPGAASLFISALTRTSTNLEITILPEYVPNNEEKSNTRLFSENVSRLMCHDLGVLQSYYSYDDVPLMPLAKDIRLFRSPACISFLKLCYKVLQKKTELEKAPKEEPLKQNDKKPSAQPMSTLAGKEVVQVVPGAAMPPLSSRVGSILGVGEDVDHAQVVAEMYYPKNYPIQSHQQRARIILEREQLLQHRWDKPLRPSSMIGLSQDEFQYLPISGARRRLFRPDNLMPPSSAMETKKRRIYNAFCQFIEHCLTHLETHFEWRLIESSEDLIKLLDLKRFVRSRSIDSIVNSLRLSSIFVDLLKIIEFSVSGPVTTVHLLVILHLCDVREHDMWARIEAAVTLFDMMREASKEAAFAVSNVQLPPATSNQTKSGRTLQSNAKAPLVNLDELRILLWYSLGLQEFNDQFFADREFDLKYLRAQLGRTFHRAVAENASQLLE